MTEKDMQLLWNKYVIKNPPRQSEVYELKICKGNSLPLKRLEDHQIKALTEAEDKFLYHRITDQPWIKGRPAFQSKKPFDCLCVVGVKAFVIVWFYTPRSKKIFYKIPIKRFLNSGTVYRRKSLTEEMAKQLGQVIQI